MKNHLQEGQVSECQQSLVWTARLNAATTCGKSTKICKQGCLPDPSGRHSRAVDLVFVQTVTEIAYVASEENFPPFRNGKWRVDAFSRQSKDSKLRRNTHPSTQPPSLSAATSVQSRKQIFQNSVGVYLERLLKFCLYPTVRTYVVLHTGSKVKGVSTYVKTWTRKKALSFRKYNWNIVLHVLYYSTHRWSGIHAAMYRSTVIRRVIKSSLECSRRLLTPHRRPSWEGRGRTRRPRRSGRS